MKARGFQIAHKACTSSWTFWLRSTTSHPTLQLHWSNRS